MMNRIRKELGTAGLVAIALIAFALAFTGFVTRPLEEKNQLLQDRGSRKSQAAQPGAEKVAAVYEYLAKPEEPTDWLAKLHGIGTATGVQIKSANYKALPAEGRIERTEIVLPVSGSYSQIRDFLKRSQAEIPVMSIDQINLKRAEKGDLVQAEMRLTLHMVKS
ncbi:MAG TPA: type 4a pilus biogenesis protein PilO [Burkholderiales bacterium]|nr:type 4a pilus biogenesis protein PilO [Burkholderiales bacterium]